MALSPDFGSPSAKAVNLCGAHLPGLLDKGIHHTELWGEINRYRVRFGLYLVQCRLKVRSDELGWPVRLGPYDERLILSAHPS